MTVGDVVDRSAAEGELTRTVSMLEAALEATADGILVVDGAGAVVRFNKKFGRMWRLPPRLLAEPADAAVLDWLVSQLRDPAGFDATIARLRERPQAESFDVLACKDGRVFERYSTPQRLGEQVSGRVWSFRDVTDRNRAAEETRLLQTLTTALGEADDLESMLLVVLGKVCETTSWALGQAWLRSEDGGGLVCGPAWARAEEEVAPFRALSLRTGFLPRVGLPGRVWASREPEWIRDLMADGRYLRATMARRVGLQAAIGFPVFVGGEVVAVLEFLVRDADAIDERRMGLVEAVTAQLGAGVERKRTEMALRDSEARYRSLVEHAPEAILEIDAARSTFVGANENAIELFGHTREALLALGPLDLSAPVQPWGLASAEDVSRRLRAAAEGGKLVFDWNCRSAAGREFPCEVRLVNLPGTGGDLPLVRASVTDISERKRVEALMAGQTRVLEMVATGVPLEETLTSLVRLIEAQSDEMLGSILLLDEDGIHLRHGAAPSLPEAYNRAIDGEPIGPAAGSCGTAAYRGEPVIVTDIQTDPLWAGYRDVAALHGLRACWSTPIRSYTGAVLGTFAMYYRHPRTPRPEDMRVIDITTHLAGIAIERRRAEEAIRRDAEEIEDLDAQRKRDQEALREREQTYRALYTRTPVMMHSIDPKGRLLSVSDDWLATLGYERSEVLGRRSLDFMVPASRCYAVEVVLPAFMRTGHCKDVPYQFVKKDGEIMDVLLSATAERDTEGRVVRSLAVLIDVTARKRAEAALQQSKEALQSVMASVSDALWSGEFDAAGRWAYRYYSPVVEKIMGRPPEYFAPGPHRWLDVVHADDRSRMEASLARLVSGASTDEEYRVIFPDGGIRWVRDSARSTRTGDRLRIDVVTSDITERKRVEEELDRYREHLEDLVAARTDKLETVNRELEAFCYSVSHDLRAPLRSIDGFSKILLEDYGVALDERGRQHLDRIRASSRRMAQLIDDLLNLSRVSRGELSMQRVDLSALARSVTDLLLESAPERRVELVIQEGVTAEGDPQLLRVVLENLFGNAWKFTSKHERARIEFGRSELDGRAVYYVRDDGAGFDMAYADKLFGAFQRLHGAHEFEGTGIGLATVQRIVHRHGGSVWARGAVERGATFYFTL